MLRKALLSPVLPITLSADKYPLLHWAIDGFQDNVAVHFIWATQNDPGNLHKTLLKPANGKNALDLHAESSWRGTIVGLGMISGRLSQPVIVHQLALNSLISRRCWRC
ncbi:MAG: hypothetical protein R3F37_10755 [Candidatus Competibacteraceae bacterium]